MDDAEVPTVRIVCTECRFSKEVEKDGNRPAEVMIDHGRETGHKLRVEDVSEE